MVPRSITVALALLLVSFGDDVQFGDTAFAAPAPNANPNATDKDKGKGKPEHIYPDADWVTEDPEDHGLSAEGLRELASVAEQMDTSCLVIIHDGVLVGEWYWNGFDRETDVVNVWSVTKSITSSLVGIAQEEGKLRIDQTVATYIPRWVGTRSETVTIRNIISNDSGRFWSFESDYITGLVPALDQTGYAIGLSQQFDPGSVWEYNNAAIQTLEDVLSQATGEDVRTYAQTRLFEPIGATARIGSDPAGNAQTYIGVSASCADMARFGYLALRDGQWKGEQIIPKNWLKQATSPSTELNDAYGYMWWLNRKGHVVLPSFPLRNEYDGQLLPDSHDQVFAAVGAFGQSIIIDPKDEYVVVRLQNITDVNMAIATSPDPMGFAQMREIATAFEAAKVKGKKKKDKDKGKDKPR